MPPVAGVADRGGRLVVPDPRSFEANTIALDPLTLSDEAQAAKTSFTLRPRDRTGVLTDFGVRQVRAARVTPGIADGTPLPLGSRAALNGGKAVPVGDEGKAYLSPLRPRNEVVATGTDGSVCRAVLTVAAGAAPVRIGPVMCR